MAERYGIIWSMWNISRYPLVGKDFGGGCRNFESLISKPSMTINSEFIKINSDTIKLIKKYDLF